MSTSARIDRQRVLRTLTFWLRPAFVLRTLNRFQSMAGFDRAIALASSAFTALVPLAIVATALLPRVDASKTANTIINRYGLTGGGAAAVRDLLSPAGGAGASISVLGGVLTVIAVLSLARGAQRLFEQAYELKPLSVRNTINDLLWIGGLVCYFAVSWGIHALLDHGRVQIGTNLVVLPLSAVFLGWSGWILSAKRLEPRRLVPFGVLGAALMALYLTGAAVYLPHLFSSYASRYGVIGAVLAMISALFGVTLVLVVSAAVGREVFDELDRIRRGERPPDDEIKREWEALLDGARSRWDTLRTEINRRRAKRSRADR